MKKNVKDSIWELVEKEAKAIVSKYPENFRFNENSEYIFKQKFDDYVEYIKSKFMQSDVVDLDSHKVAAIIICSVIEANVIKVIYEYDEEKLLFDGNEKIAINIGLSYMSSVMKKLLQGTKEEGKFDEYTFPRALMCDTEYKEILARNLYYAKTYFILNPIDIANTLFLLENYTLIKLDIDLNVVREECQKLVKVKS